VSQNMLVYVDGVHTHSSQANTDVVS